ncbi:hypothetical protein BJX68DRAFT_241333 [Aspergillus pseudodeflectus]|uniref:Uncharacterized protein n=1 Tax=Aspergillus pseudodeflectus TaxID=176178 RepID=A0ABR4K0X5_9EURO
MIYLLCQATSFFLCPSEFLICVSGAVSSPLYLLSLVCYIVGKTEPGVCKYLPDSMTFT